MIEDLGLMDQENMETVSMNDYEDVDNDPTYPKNEKDKKEDTKEIEAESKNKKEKADGGTGEPKKKIEWFKPVMFIIILLAIAFIGYICGTLIHVHSYNKIPKDMIVETGRMKIDIELDDKGLLQAYPKETMIKFHSGYGYIDDIQANYGRMTKLIALDMFTENFIIQGCSDDVSEQYIDYISANTPKIRDFTQEAMDACFNKGKPYVDYIVSRDIDGYGTYNAYNKISSIYKKAGIYSCVNYNKELDNVAKNHCDNVRHNIKYINKDINTADIDKIISINGLGEFNLKDYDAFGTECGFLFLGSNGLFTIYDNAPDADHGMLMITTMYNQKLQNTEATLIPVPGYKNLYVDKGFQNRADFGYGVFAVTTENGTYAFKVTEGVEDLAGFTKGVIEWLGIKPEDEQQGTPIETTLTMEDMMEVYVGSEDDTEDTDEALGTITVDKDGNPISVETNDK